jgi:hypothetical protein
VSLVLLIAFTIQFLKLIFKLIMAYIMILMTTALGPLYITASMLPGRGNLVGMWWKTLLGNALVFPAVFALFLFAGMIMRTDQSLWASTPPFFGNFSTQLLQPIVAFVIILGTPAVPDMVKKAVGAVEVGDIGKQGTAGFAAGYGAAQGGVKRATEKVWGPVRGQREAYQKAYDSALAQGIETPKYRGGRVDPKWYRNPVEWIKKGYITAGRTSD